MYNTIHMLKDNQGNWLENIDQVLHLLADHSKKIFASSMPSNSDIDDVLMDIKPIISDDLNSELVAILSENEIFTTVKNMAPWKSPGPDGFLGGFFRDNWDHISTEVINHSAFIANRKIHDNIIICHEILHSFKTRKRKNNKDGFMAIKLDLSKAFDRLEWPFVIVVFKKLGFSDDWCQLIHQCIIIVSYSILVNGSPGEMFSPSRDDCMLFSKASLVYAKNLMIIINKFAKASGQAINLEKSGFFTSKKMYHKHIKLISKALGIKFLSSTEKYLGKSKISGGLGIRNYFSTNRVLIAKLGWRMCKNPSQLVNDGKSTKIWNHNWLPSYTCPPSSINSDYENYVYVNELINHHDNNWNINILSSLFSPKDSIRIRSLKINVYKSDEIMWAHINKGNYSVKSAYKAFMNENVSTDDATFWKRIWSIDCLPKIKFFIWKIFVRMLPVNSLIKFYNPGIDECCPLCSNEVESVMHLFIQCPIASHIWFSLSFHHLIAGDYYWIDDICLSWFDKKLDCYPYVVNWPSIGDVVLWSIWKLRCHVIFRKAPIQHINHIFFIGGSFKNFNMGIGLILCDNAGRIKGCRADFGLIHGAVAAEAMALILACSWVGEMNLSRVLFISDCLQLVDLVNQGKGDIDWRSQDLVEDCRISFSSCVNSRIVFIKRSKNKIADRLARRAR
ncbi:uncharacterized protein LOC113360081 [Papaver somniferum]|uniref:uncharacterized protein LOC113360081 n=1 Tax=Papaver somniferum TaxID=3469 RepID=UPI000E6FCFCF|nr:uncharacterized protein LOC113360081 [Papaver somniferum]